VGLARGARSELLGDGVVQAHLVEGRLTVEFVGIDAGRAAEVRTRHSPGASEEPLDRTVGPVRRLQRSRHRGCRQAGDECEEDVATRCATLSSPTIRWRPWPHIEVPLRLSTRLPPGR
jgi:hypothetical protein